MSTIESPESTQTAAGDQPIPPSSGRTGFQRRRRRRLLITAAVAAVIAAAGITAGVTLSDSGSGTPSFVVAYGQGNVANADSIIQTQSSISAPIKAKLKFVPFNAGVTAIAELRSGALQAISGVGNPPVVGAIGNGTNVVVVIAQSFDADALIVPPSITSAQ